MQLEASEEEFELLYNRARESYARCISSEENTFLQKEVSISLEAIAVRNASISIVFHQNFTADYLLEVELGLYTNGSYMGKYTYSEDKKGDEMENGLVFY